MLIYWPDSLREISHNMNTTELWVLIQAFNAGNCHQSLHQEFFGYHEYWLDYVDERYLVRVANGEMIMAGERSDSGRIYFVKKYNDIKK